LAGDNENEAALISMYGHQLGDLFNQIAAFNNEDDEQEREVLGTRLFNQTWPLNLRFFETRLIRNGRNGFLVGNRYSWADLFLSELIENIPSSRINLLDNYPHVKNLNFAIRSLPQIRKWIATRPLSDF
jgi:glutathione S-transferase